MLRWSDRTERQILFKAIAGLLPPLAGTIERDLAPRDIASHSLIAFDEPFNAVDGKTIGPKSLVDDAKALTDTVFQRERAMEASVLDLETRLRQCDPRIEAARSAIRTIGRELVPVGFSREMLDGDVGALSASAMVSRDEGDLTCREQRPGKRAASSAANSRRFLAAARHAVRKLKRVQILLAADAGATDAEIARSARVAHGAERSHAQGDH